MTKKNDGTWQTKYGARRVREEKPVLAEAIAAAQGLTDDLDEQAGIAAALMGMPVADVRAELAKLAPPRRDSVKSVVFTGSASAPRTIVVERKISRRIIPAANRPTRTAAV